MSPSYFICSKSCRKNLQISGHQCKAPWSLLYYQGSVPHSRMVLVELLQKYTAFTKIKRLSFLENRTYLLCINQEPNSMSGRIAKAMAIGPEHSYSQFGVMDHLTHAFKIFILQVILILLKPQKASCRLVFLSVIFRSRNHKIKRQKSI